MRITLLLGAIAVIAAPTVAGPVLPITGTRHAVYDLNTGTTEQWTDRYGDSIWAATQRSGYYFAQMSYGAGTTTLDWGDIDDTWAIDGFAISYGTDVVLPERLDCVFWFFANENGFNSTERVPLAGFELSDLPTADPAGAWDGWTITPDLMLSGEAFSITGPDLDADGLTDFGYTYWFTNYTPTAENNTGPTIAGDPNAIPQTAPGIEDVFDQFADPNLSVYVDTYWFGGESFAQFYLELFGWLIPDPPCPSGYYTADIDCGSHPCDCVVGLADLAQLLAHYGMTENATHGMGDVDCWYEEGQCWGDGDVDLADLAVLLSQYGDDCN